MAKMLRRNRKQSRITFSPFTKCACCAGPIWFGRAAEERQWQRDQRVDIGPALRPNYNSGQPAIRYDHKEIP